MTQDNSATNSPGHSSQSGGPSEAKPPQPAPPPKRKRRWLRRIIVAAGGLVITLLVLVGLTPALLSTGAGRNFVVAKINKSINGRVEIRDWSLGWTSGVHVQDVKVFDLSNRPILDIPKFSTDLSLVAAMRG